jgi:hypothetical protein
MMLVLLACSCTPKGERPTGCADARGLEATARNVFGVEVAPKPVLETDENLTALRSGTYTVGQRSDSRTYFVRNRAWGPLADEGVFTGADEVLQQKAAKILSGLKIDPRELSREKVLQMVQGAGEFDEVTGQAKSDLWESKQRVLVAGRQVDGVPVFSSRLYLALTASGEIGRLKLHWPEIPAPVLAEARRYQELVRRGFKPPAAKEPVASITAGVLHSSPRSRLLDMMAAIRVEYAKGKLGKARVVYLNAAGQQVRARHDDHTAPPRVHKPATAIRAPG